MAFQTICSLMFHFFIVFAMGCQVKLLLSTMHAGSGVYSKFIDFLGSVHLRFNIIPIGFNYLWVYGFRVKLQTEHSIGVE